MIRLISILPSIEIVGVWYDIQNKILQYKYILSGKMGNFHSATYLVQNTVLDYWDKGVQIFQKILIHIEFSCSLQSTYQPRLSGFFRKNNSD